ncbi:MAG: hypothetical protein AVDCRST_MAG31-135 [uncultured Sphingomonas sp.]|uniref:HTH luxR-type domain-containing protein n=1 Tax=uncultured Sphingomonas sp. TaxID=158754 RepID=A0A6J4SFG9_9SPHN|nr:MAG: hypothetical protein AVDCRST_MAG31-135 [uncultured Sphingomonas sp.]
MVSVGEVHKLTPRQKELLRLVSSGFDAKSAARELGISVHTVNEHLTQARRHLGVSSSREAARILQQAEATPLNGSGPQPLGVDQPATKALSDQRISPKQRLAFVGVTLMILAVAVASLLSVAGAGSPANSSRHGVDESPVSSGAPQANLSPYESRSVSVGRFDQLRVSGPFKVGVLVNEQSGQIRLQGPAALLADAIVKAEGGILTIRYREGATWSWNPGSGVNVFVSTPALTAAKVEGAAEVEIGGVSGDHFIAQLDGAGSLGLRLLDVRHIQLATAGSGGITAEGRARNATYVVGGAGPIDAKRLEVENASIAVGGSGSAYADVAKAANVSVNGSGRVEVVGGATCARQPPNSRQIICR